MSTSKFLQLFMILWVISCVTLIFVTPLQGQGDRRPPSSPTKGPIDEKYKALGGSNGFLGIVKNPVSSKVAGGLVKHYKGGSIYWHPETGAHVVQGKILEKYRATGGAGGLLGFPKTDELKADKGGRKSHFQRGSIFWHPETGAHEIHGAIRNKWADMGWEKSLLGYPKTDETKTPDGKGRFNHFQGGSVYWHPNTGAHEIHGAIKKKWASLGYERSRLGFPITDELRIADGNIRFTKFQSGAIYWTREKGAFVYKSPQKDQKFRTYGGRSIIGGSPTLQGRVDDAFNKFLDVVAGKPFEDCIRNAELKEVSNETRWSISSKFWNNKVTDINIKNLKGKNGLAKIGINGEEINLDEHFVANNSIPRIAGVIGHELAHNYGYNHTINYSGTKYYPLTVPEQVEACITRGVPNKTNPATKDLWVRIQHKGLYVASFNIHWTVDGKKDKWESGIKSVGYGVTKKLPYRAKDIIITGISYPKKEIFRRTLCPGATYTVRGTTVHPKVSIENCN